MGKKLCQIFRSEKFFKNILKVLKRKKTFFAKMGKNVSFTQKRVKNFVKFPDCFKKDKKRFFAKMGKNVSFTQKWVKNFVKFSGSEKFFKNILKVLKRIKKAFFHKNG